MLGWARGGLWFQVGFAGMRVGFLQMGFLVVELGFVELGFIVA